MTDQIYYKVQYPLKKVINMIKNIDPEDPFAGETEKKVAEKGIQEIDNFIKMWEEEGKINLQDVIKRLKKIQ